MTGIENNYGIPRDQFAAALAAGTSPQEILSHAPKNAPSMDLLNKIADGLAANNTAGDAAARLLASSSNGGGAGLGAPTGADTTAATAKGTKAPTPTADDLETNPDLAVSPEVRAAMLAKAAQLKADKEMQDMHGWNIFQLVHNRYQKLESMLYGRVERTNPNPTKGF
ncbi:MAG: hypothetical protein ACXWSD_19645, partial [Bdellovibrionota bacterium]